MRRLVVALVVVVFAASLAGCGGGGDAEQAQQPEPGNQAAPAPPPSAPAGEALIDRTPLEAVLFSRFPSGDGRSMIATDVPEAVTERLEAEQPMLLFFFDKAQKTTDDQRVEIDAVMKSYRGTIDKLSFDVGQDLDDGKHDDTDAQAVALARAVEVSFTPYIVVVDGQGLITWRYRGFVDRGVIEREVLRATQ
ncbi:MAG: hypothetical protein IBX62_01680 [Coriobacteriia bacterium]|nr:hypothetical protein [Coriobacteriia bacterium]